MSVLPADPARWDCHVHVFAGHPQPGAHYTPPTCSLPMWAAAAVPHGFGHVVLVQPSVYGTDNRLLLDALGAAPGLHRGVVVLNEDVTEGALAAMHALGVRGARFNLVSPVGNDARQIAEIAARVRPLGWHLQLFLRPTDLSWVRAQHAAWNIDLVLDHLAGIAPGVPLTSQQLADLQGLGEAGAWIKASGFYRLGMTSPYTDVVPLLRKLAAWFPQQMVWGSDWPHTWFMEPAHCGVPVPDFAQLLAPLDEVFLDPQTCTDLFSAAPRRLYG